MFYQVSALVFFATVFTLYQIYPASPDTLLLSSFALAQLLLLYSLETQHIDLLHYAFALAIPITIFCAQKRETLMYAGAVVAITLAIRWYRDQNDLTPRLFTASADNDGTFTNWFGDVNVQHYFTGCLVAILYRLNQF